MEKLSPETKKLLNELWEQLHSYAPTNVDKWEASDAKNFYITWRKRIPSESLGCPCQRHWNVVSSFRPPVFSTAKSFFEWTWAVHDDISEQHSNAERITLEEAYELYWPPAPPKS